MPLKERDRMKHQYQKMMGFLFIGLMLGAATLPFTVGGETQPSSSSSELKTKLFNFIDLLTTLVIKRVVNPFSWILKTMGDTSYNVVSFSSYSQLKHFLLLNCQKNNNYGSLMYEDSASPRVSLPSTMNTKESMSYGASVDFSQTNIQVAGVDEPDTVKTDGSYIYMVTDSKVLIIRAYPVAEAGVVAEIPLDTYYVQSLFVNNDQLILFGQSATTFLEYDEYYATWYEDSTVIKIYDISDRSNPQLQKTIDIDGMFFDARMIGQHVYVIATKYTYNIYRVLENKEDIVIPEISIDGESEKIPADHIYYVDIPEQIDTMTHVLSINLEDTSIVQKSFLLGSSQTMYVSEHNIYLTYAHYANRLLEYNSNDNTETTILHKISIDDGEISYLSQGEVPGNILNQFSMDEFNGFFRIATTSGSFWGGTSSNNVYILDKDLQQVSALENIAPGERIYSARFMGEKAYLVTFKKIDPFFTLDLSDPYAPEILGKLKIPGYSDYLHPYDENHIIGVGKDTVEALDDQKQQRNLDFAWYQGLKIALFDVSDFEHLKEVAKVVIGDRGTTSEALQNHKAFLFDKDRHLLVLPVNLFEIPEDIKAQHQGYTGSTYGEFTFQGAYVYSLSVEQGFELRGRITHLASDDTLQSGYYGYYGSETITRSLYIDTALYTLSESTLKINDLTSLEELQCISLV